MSAAANPAAPASEAAGERGRRERRLWGTNPLPHLELGWRAEAARRERAAAVGEVCGGGVRDARGGTGGGGRRCGAQEPRQAPFIAGEWRWDGAGRWGEVMASGEFGGPP